MGLRTDMAYEAAEANAALPGITQAHERIGGIDVTRVRIETPDAAKALDKPMGAYITLERGEAQNADAFARAVAGELAAMLNGIRGHVLVVGLGNRFITPDSLGPRTLDGLFVTRHIRAFAPELMPRGMRDVSAVAPGVLGITGLETAEVVSGVVARVKPDALLCVDALVSLRADRIGMAVQMNDSGLMPGAGVNNRQRGLSADELGLPVFAIGVPTVVHADTIARETARLLTERTGLNDEGDAMQDMAAELIRTHTGEMIVTPKDVDKLVGDAARMLSKAINHALHGALYDTLFELLEA